MVKLDIKDRKILFELDRNSRQSYLNIAKKVGLGKDSIIYRIQQMENEGIIKGYHTILDVRKLGFIPFRLYLKFQNTTPKKEEEIINYLNKQKIINWIVSVEGNYDLNMAIYVKSIKEMNNLWKNIISRYGNYLEKRWLSIFTKVSYYPREYLLDGKRNKDEYTFITESEIEKINEIDLKIIEMLAPNARISILEIADKLKITPKTVSSRIKHLEKNMIIKGYRAIFDLEKLNYQHFKLHITLHNTMDEDWTRLKEYIKHHPNIIFDNEVLGGDDVEIEIQTKSLKEFRIILNEMKASFSKIIKNFYYMLYYKEHKFSFYSYQ
jgi:DNA-binding Lrp family transcriptional regulator